MKNKGEAVLATFLHVDSFLACLKELKDDGRTILDAFSPVHLPAMQDVMTPRPSLTRAFTLAGGIIGATGIVSLAAYAHLSFRLIVYGKPIIAWVPWVLVAFEGTILFASLFAFVSWVFTAGLPRPGTDRGYNAGLSGHRFGILVKAPDEERAEIVRLLKKTGAEEVNPC